MLTKKQYWRGRRLPPVIYIPPRVWRRYLRMRFGPRHSQSVAVQLEMVRAQLPMLFERSTTFFERIYMMSPEERKALMPESQLPEHYRK